MYYVHMKQIYINFKGNLLFRSKSILNLGEGEIEKEQVFYKENWGYDLLSHAMRTQSFPVSALNCSSAAVRRSFSCSVR